jgi:putative FmdB family regulatory protein
MPIYEYRCRKGHDFEVRQGFSDDPVSTCDVCGAPVRRVFRPPAVHFKGSGFYNTDYGTRNRSREMKEAKEGSSGESSKDGAKTSESTSVKSDSGKSDSGAKKTETKAAKASD